MLLLLLAPPLATATHGHFHRGMLPERARRGALANAFAPPPAAAAEAEAAAARWLQVPLDYDAPKSGSFRIRYFLDTSAFHASNDSAPIFVSMGGEGTARGAHCSAAGVRHAALCVSVEHRFYGESVPASGVTDANYWAGLRVEYNLADTAAVVGALQALYPTSSKAKRAVIAFGGSYSGATCAWFRQAHPDAVDACVSSSGVVNAIVDFPQFDEHVAAAVGPACASALSAAYAAVDRALDAGQASALKAQFNASNLDGTRFGDSDFLYAIADGPAMLDQYGSKRELCAQPPRASLATPRSPRLARHASLTPPLSPSSLLSTLFCPPLHLPRSPLPLSPLPLSTSPSHPSPSHASPF